MKRYNFEYYDEAPHDSGMEESEDGAYVRYDDIPFLAFPCHCHFLGSKCCGIFMEITDDGLICNECGMKLEDAMSQLYNEVETTLRAMWGGGRQGAHINFSKCETDAMNMWIALSKKFGMFGD